MLCSPILVLTNLNDGSIHSCSKKNYTHRQQQEIQQNTSIYTYTCSSRTNHHYHQSICRLLLTCSYLRNIFSMFVSCNFCYFNLVTLTNYLISRKIHFKKCLIMLSVASSPFYHVSNLLFDQPCTWKIARTNSDQDTHDK